MIRAARGAWENFSAEPSGERPAANEGAGPAKPLAGASPDSYRELANALAMAMEAARSAQGVLRKRPPSDAA